MLSSASGSAIGLVAVVFRRSNHIRSGMINRDSAAERAKAIQVAIDRFKRQKKAVPEYLLKLAGEKPEPTPVPEPAPEPDVVEEVTVTTEDGQSEAPADAPPVDSADEKAADQPEKPVAKRGRPPRR